MQRDDHLFGPGPKRILALDGGGTRGIIELAFLARIEALLRERLAGGNADFRLADWFDLIGGTSTGAIIAAGLALGKTTAEITRLYLELGPSAFRRRRWRLTGLVPRFDARPLTRFLEMQLGTRALGSADLRTGLAVMAQRFDTGSPWLFSNNPRAPYWNDPPDGGFIGNHRYQLTEVVRASTAAPGFFRPQWIQVVTGQRPGLFTDGGLSPYNNPSLMLLMMTQARAYGLQWTLSPDQLLLVSVGAGHHRRGLPNSAVPPMTAGGLALHALLDAVTESQTQALALLQWFSEPAMPWSINSEVGDLRGEVFGGRPLLGFQRYDMLLEAEWLQTQLGMRLTHRALERLRRIDDPSCMQELHAMATQVAEQQVRIDHLVAPNDGDTGSPASPPH